MPRIFDNIDLKLLPVLCETLQVSDRSDFCVGYFNLRGWRALDCHIERWSGGDGHCCRLLVGMQRPPEDQLRVALQLAESEEEIDNQTALRIKRTLAEQFRNQLMIGYPTNEDEAGLRRLAAQIKAKKVAVKLFVRHPLHAKLYLLFRPDPNNPITAFLGSSNLTMSGLASQGELNVDVLDHDATRKLAGWFEDRWTDRWCIDISEELVEIIEQSWAREELLSPYHIYLKMAYHLSREARAGLTEFRFPRLPRQALRIPGRRRQDRRAPSEQTRRRRHRRRGRPGQNAHGHRLARIFEDDHGLRRSSSARKTWCRCGGITSNYRLRAKVLSITVADPGTDDSARFRLVLIDESHNLRNREGKTYRAIQEYVSETKASASCFPRRLTRRRTPVRTDRESCGAVVCTTPEFDDLAKAVGIKSHKQGVTEFAGLASSGGNRWPGRATFTA